MRGKRTKQYRKLMQRYGLTFGFREPYQVLVDAQMIQDSERFKMNLVGGLERTLSGKVKPMITQCSIRHLYSLASPDTPSSLKDTFIATAKTMERRRCNHHELDKPLSTLECLSNVIDPKNLGTNKNRYVIASQEPEVRRFCRSLKGVPLVYVKRSVMIMEPMSEGSVGVRECAEIEKFRQGLRGRVASLGKRKREGEAPEDGYQIDGTERKAIMDDEEQVPKKKRTRGPKGPNPLSVKKSKAEIKMKAAKLDDENRPTITPESDSIIVDKANMSIFDRGETDDIHSSKRKRRRRRQKYKNKDIPVTAEDEKSGDGT